MHGVRPTHGYLVARPPRPRPWAPRPNGLPASTPTPAGPVMTGADAPDDAPTRAAQPFSADRRCQRAQHCRTLASYGIEPGTTLDCVLALRGGAPTADGPGAPADDPVDAAPQALPQATAAPHHGRPPCGRALTILDGAPPPSAPRDDDGRPGTRSAFEARGVHHDDQRGACRPSRDACVAAP